MVFASPLFSHSDTLNTLMKMKGTDRERAALIIDKVANGYSKNYEVSLDLINAAIQLSTQANSTSHTAYAYYYKGRIYYELADYSNAISALKSASTIVRTTKRDTILIRIYALIADSYTKIQQADSVFIFRNNQLKEAKSFNDSSAITRAYLGRGLDYWGLGENFEAYKNFLAAAEISTIRNDNRAIGLSYFNMASIHYRWGDYAKALEYYKVVYEIAVKTKDEHRRVKVICNIGFMYASMGLLAEADSAYSEASKIAEDKKYQDLITYSYFLKGGLYNKTGEYKKAIEQYLLGLPLFLKQLDHGGYAQGLAGLGEAYGKLGDNQNALQFYNQSVTVARSYRDDFSLSIVLLSFANYMIEQTNYGYAKTLIKEALTVSRKRNIRTNVAGSLLLLSDIAEKEGNKIGCLQYLIQYDQARDSLNQEKSLSALQEFRITYATQKQKIENDVLKREMKLRGTELQKKNLFTIVIASLISVGLFGLFGGYQLNKVRKKVEQETEEQNNKLKELNNKLSAQNVELSQAIKTRDVMFSIISVDLKQPFISLLGYTDLLVNRFDEMLKEEIVSVARNINSASFELFNLIVNLFEWSRLQTVGVSLLKSELKVNELVNKAIYSLQRMADAKSVQLVFDYQEECTIEGDDSALSLTLRNLLLNAIAHSPENGKVYIELINRGNQITITITEEGKLYSKEEVANMLEFNEVDQLKTNIAENSTTLRFVVAYRFISLSGGTLAISPYNTLANEYSISFPPLQH